VANPKNKPNLSTFSQKHAQVAFRSKLKQQKCHKIWKKSNLQSRNLKKTSPKINQISIKTSPKTSNRQVLKKTQLHRKTNPNSRENRKAGNTAPQRWSLSGLTVGGYPQDSEFETGYGYPKTAFKREPVGSGYPKRFYRCFEDSQFWKKLHFAQSFIYYLQKHHFSLLCHDSQFVHGVI